MEFSEGIKETLRLHLDGWNYEEIAQQLGSSEASIAKRVQRAKKEIKNRGS